MARRTRRPAVVWLPCFPTTSFTNDGIALRVVHDISSAGNGRITSVHQLTIDNPAEQLIANADPATLSDFEGSAYRLRRIVGKCFVGINQADAAATGDPTIVYCTAGFIVLRVDPLTGLPIGIAAADANYSPQAFGSERDPWIWRRSWMLGVSAANPSVVTTSNATCWPPSNSFDGSVADGPHVDAKTARAVKDEERLFFVACTQFVEGLGQGETTRPVTWSLDYRLLASMYKSSGNRRNASR